MFRHLPLPFLCLIPAFAMAADVDFDRDVRPVLNDYCIRCHGPDREKGKVRFDTLSTDMLADSAAAETWHDALNALQLGEMPPDDEAQPSDAERKVLSDWINDELQRAIAAKQSSGGRVVIRRLNRVEYQNTMQDLLRLDLNYVRNLPSDPLSPDGFQNNGASLGMSAMQLEHFLATARNALSRAIVLGPEPEPVVHLTEKSDADKGRGNFTNQLARSGVFVSRVPDFPEEGEFEIRVRAHAKLPTQDSAYPVMKVDLGYRADTQRPSREVARIDVAPESREYVLRGRLEEFPLQSRVQSKYPGLLIWVSNAYHDGKNVKEAMTIETVNPKNPKKKSRKTIYEADPDFPQIVVESVEFKSPIFEAWPPNHHRQILPDSATREEGELVYMREVLEQFLARAFRRPPTEVEVKNLQRYFAKVRPTFETFEEAARETLAMALISPEFLFLVEPGSSDEKRPLNEYELASRLSYFLWSSMPDDRLFELAKAGTLSDPATLSAEVERMLQSPKSRRFVKQFTGQWLDLDQLDRVAINPEYYPDFDPALKPWMRQETEAFFAEILEQNLSALLFLDSDFVMANEPLARHYGLENGPRTTAFEKVVLASDSRRGGLLTQASTLLGASTGEDSHPIKRAVWIRERLLHDPPAPPPPDVPSLDAENPDFAKLTVREQLAAHRDEPGCVDCHRGIDPWGIALEHFDAVGLYRETIRRKAGKKFVSNPVVAMDVLPGGHEVKGVEELRAFLLTERKDQFAHALVSKLLSYAVGRTLELTDEPEIEGIRHEFAENDYRLRKLVEIVVSSEAFRTK